MMKMYFMMVIALLCLLPTQESYAGNDKITVQLKWSHDFQFAGFYMALEKGYYHDVGLDVSLLEGGPGKSSVAYVRGRKNAYGVSSTGALLERSYGKAIKVVGAIFQHSPLMLMTRTDTGIEKVQDLRGKRIMLQQGYQNVGIIASLQALGISQSDFIRQDISYDIQDLIEKRTDAYAVYATNQAYQLNERHLPYYTFNPNDQGIDFYGDIVITSDEEVNNHPARVRAFMEATSRGWRDALENPNEAIDLILLKYNTQQMTREYLQFEAKETVKFILPDVVKPGYMNIFRWQRIAQVYIEQGFLAADYPLEEFVYFPKPTLLDFMKDRLWQILLVILLLVILFFGISVFTLRRLVQSKTHDLKESENNYRKLLELAGIGIVVHREGEILFANAYALQCFQLPSLKDAQGNGILQYVHTDDRAAVMDRLRNVVQGGSVYSNVPVRCIGGNGRCIDTEVGSMLIQYYGEPAVLTAVADVTERKREALESAKIQKQMEHTQRLESLGVLAGGIAHDFNNLLAVILGHADMAALEVERGSKVQGHLKHVMSASENAAALCKQMLAYSGQGKFVVEPLNLSKISQDMLELIEVAVGKKVTIKYQTDVEIPLIEADVSQVQQVIMNLVTNASESMDEHGGVMEVSVGKMDVDATYLDGCSHESVEPGCFVYIEVNDIGCGMDSGVMEKLFEPFFTTKFTGRGLGMSATLGIVRGHHGAIHIESQVHVGTRIRVLFPCASETIESDEVLAIYGEKHAFKGLVLLVDDEENILEMATAMLEHMGFEIVVARNGQEALDIYRKQMHEITMVLLDLTMPILDGRGAFVGLCKLNPKVQVIICSGYIEEDVRGRYKELEGAIFVHKPYKLDALQQAVEQLLI